MSSTTSTRRRLATTDRSGLRDEPARSRAGLTLIELILALALLVALTAIVAPAMNDVLAERSFESTREVLTHQLLLARSHAQATGEAVEVVYDADSRVVSARLFGAFADEAERSEDASLIRALPFSDDTGMQVRERWAHRRLPRPMRLSDEPPVPADEVLTRPGTIAATAAGIGPEPPLRLAVYL
ncbi:MAG: hypothetical protein ACYTGC_17260, partial [Planctomycetota bacterium]